MFKILSTHTTHSTNSTHSTHSTHSTQRTHSTHSTHSAHTAHTAHTARRFCCQKKRWHLLPEVFGRSHVNWDRFRRYLPPPVRVYIWYTLGNPDETKNLITLTLYVQQESLPFQGHTTTFDTDINIRGISLQYKWPATRRNTTSVCPQLQLMKSLYVAKQCKSLFLFQVRHPRYVLYEILEIYKFIFSFVHRACFVKQFSINQQMHYIIK
jgi:hypothetical protein